MFNKCYISDEALKGIDHAIELICKEMTGCITEETIALAKVLRDIVVARAILTEMTDALGKL